MEVVYLENIFMKWKIPLLMDLNGKVIEKDDEIALLQHQTVVVCFNTGCANEKACISGDNLSLIHI